MTQNTLPTPVWNSTMNNWEPVDFRNGQRIVKWPAGFNPQLLPVPEYNEGDHVQFVRDETCAREGIIRQILFQVDMSRFLKEDEQRFDLDTDAIIYIVTARGHDHRIKPSYILGRFVSLERLSRVFPLQE